MPAIYARGMSFQDLFMGGEHEAIARCFRCPATMGAPYLFVFKFVVFHEYSKRAATMDLALGGVAPARNACKCHSRTYLSARYVRPHRAGQTGPIHLCAYAGRMPGGIRQ